MVGTKPSVRPAARAERHQARISSLSRSTSIAPVESAAAGRCWGAAGGKRSGRNAALCDVATGDWRRAKSERSERAARVPCAAQLEARSALVIVVCASYTSSSLSACTRGRLASHHVSHHARHHTRCTSHSTIEPSSQPATSMSPFGLQQVVGAAESHCTVAQQLPVAASQSFMVRSMLLDAIVRPSGLQQHDLTEYLCPCSVAVQSNGAAVDQIFSFWSALAVTQYRPSGLHAQACTTLL